MDIILTIIAALIMLLGIIGSFIPILPGPLTNGQILFNHNICHCYIYLVA